MANLAHEVPDLDLKKILQAADRSRIEDLGYLVVGHMEELLRQFPYASIAPAPGTSSDQTII